MQKEGRNKSIKMKHKLETYELHNSLAVIYRWGKETKINYQLEGVILIKHQILSTDLQGIMLKVEGRLLLGRHMEL